MSINKITLTIIFLIVLVISNDIFGQERTQRISFTQPNSTFEIELNKSNRTKNYVIGIEVNKKDTIRIDANFKVILGNVTSEEQKEFKILTPTLFIPKNTTSDKKFEIVLAFQARGEEKNPYAIEIKLAPLDEESKKIKIEPNNRHLIIVKNGKQSKIFDDKQSFKAEDFRIDLGTNFDFLDGVDAGGLYANVFTFAPNLFNKATRNKSTIKSNKAQKGESKIIETSTLSKIKKKEPSSKLLKLGLISGIRQSRLIGDTVNSTRREFAYTLVSQNGPDSLNYIRSTFRRTSKTVVNSTSLYFNPIFTLKENEKAAIYFGPNIEIIRQAYSTKTNFTLTGTDSTTISSNVRLRSFNPSEEFKRTFHNFSFGFKVPIFFQVKKININIVPSFGYSKRSYSGGSYNEGYYGVYFNAIELGSGINLGGEVNVFISKSKENEGFSVRSPIIGIYLSKAFNLTPLGKYRETIN